MEPEYKAIKRWDVGKARYEYGLEKSENGTIISINWQDPAVDPDQWRDNTVAHYRIAKPKRSKKES